MRHISWPGLAAKICHDTSLERHQDLIAVIPYLPLKLRKEILKIARTQSSLEKNPFLKSQISYRRTAHASVQRLYTIPKVARRIPASFKPEAIVTQIGELVDNNPVIASIISVLARSAPIMSGEKDIEDNRIQSWEKEILASTGRDRGPVLDFGIWFGDQSIVCPLSPFLESCPGTNQTIKHIFHQSKEFFAQKTLYPQLSSVRHVSQTTAELFDIALGSSNIYGNASRMASVRDLERFYADTGREVLGPCELRQSWRYNDLTPRTYFAQGGKAYFSSRYIRPIVNAIANLFPGVSFKTRFSIHRIPLSKDRFSFTYDYSSFTSNLTELKYFLRALSEFYEDVTVKVVDTHYGVVDKSLGGILQLYLENSTLHPEFTIHRYLSHVFAPLVHNRSGMLGVYGNIGFSTILHGLHACQLCGADTLCNCVGDDVFGSGPAEYMDEEFIEAIESLGEINREKIRYWPYRDDVEGDFPTEQSRKWPYCKRPLERIDNRANHEVAYFLPIIGAVVPFSDDARPYLQENLSSEHVYLFGVQCRSLARQLFASPPASEEERQQMYRYMKTLYEVLRLPIRGLLPWQTLHWGHREDDEHVELTGLFLPHVDTFLTCAGEWYLLEECFPNFVVRIPETCSFDDSPRHNYCARTGSAESRSSSLFSLGEKMGWLSKERLYRDFLFDDFSQYRSFYTDLMSHELASVYSYRLLDSVPSWYHNTLLVS